MGIYKYSSASRVIRRTYNCTCGGFSPHCSKKHALHPIEPDPHKFTIEKLEHIGNFTIILANYPNCTTYNGRKLILLKGIHKNLKVLDPHFLGKNHPVIARFEPTTEGWKLARICAKNL